MNKNLHLDTRAFTDEFVASLIAWDHLSTEDAINLSFGINTASLNAVKALSESGMKPNAQLKQRIEESRRLAKAYGELADRLNEKACRVARREEVTLLGEADRIELILAPLISAQADYEAGRLPEHSLITLSLMVVAGIERKGFPSCQSLACETKRIMDDTGTSRADMVERILAMFKKREEYVQPFGKSVN